MTNRSPLADQFAGLRAIPTTPNAVSRILSTALHTLIAAIFARIFARLEQILALWQAGTLPAPQPRAPARPVAAQRPGAGAQPLPRGQILRHSRLQLRQPRRRQRAVPRQPPSAAPPRRRNPLSPPRAPPAKACPSRRKIPLCGIADARLNCYDIKTTNPTLSHARILPFPVPRFRV